LICYLAGLTGFLLFPAERFNKGTYFSENALLIGAANTEASDADFQNAAAFSRQVSGYSRDQ
jgi:hypothetical protein